MRWKCIGVCVKYNKNEDIYIGAWKYNKKENNYFYLNLICFNLNLSKKKKQDEFYYKVMCEYKNILRIFKN